LETYGAKAFVQLTEAVKGAQRIHLTLSDDQSVDEVLEKASAGFDPGVIIIDHTTTSSPGAAKRSAYWKKKDLPIYMLPFLWGPPNALESTGVMLVSGDQQVVRLLELRIIPNDGKLWNLGEQPEKAASIKLLGNLFHISLTGGIADLLTLAGTLNIPASDLVTLLEALNPAVVAQGRLKRSPAIPLTNRPGN
jgi:3-hydroxyisobutyrate dehydrogenase